MNFKLVRLPSLMDRSRSHFRLSLNIDSQYRQIANGDNGSLAGFLYLPQLHTVLNVLRDFFNSCHYVTIIFCGEI